MKPARGYWHGRRVCVTGGTGFLGWQIVRRLLDLGANVRILAIRPNERHPILEGSRVETIYGDVRDFDLVRKAVAGCSTIFHTAGVVGAWGKLRERIWSVNVEGTENVLRALDRGTRLVHTSSLTTIGASRHGEALTEESPFNLEGTKIAYVLSKRAAERAVLKAATDGCDAVVTNPGYLVGPEDHECSIMGRLCVRYWKGRVPLAPPGGFNLVDVRDVAVGHLLAAEHGASGRRYLLGGENHRLSGFLRMLAEVAGFRPRLMLRMPWLFLAAAAGIAELRSKITGREPYPSLGHVRLNGYNWFGSSRRAESELGYRTRPLIESLRDTFAWNQNRDSIEPRGLPRWLMRPAA